MEIKLNSFTFIIEVTNYEHVKGSYNYNAPSDLDYYGYTNIDFNTLQAFDEQGNELTGVDFHDVTNYYSEAIEQEIIKQYSEH